MGPARKCAWSQVSTLFHDPRGWGPSVGPGGRVRATAAAAVRPGWERGGMAGLTTKNAITNKASYFLFTPLFSRG